MAQRTSTKRAARSIQPTDVEARWFFSKLTGADASGCRRWTGAGTGNGYGALRIRGLWMMARRLAWILEHGSDPQGRITATCGVKRCCAAAHLIDSNSSDIANASAAQRRARAAEGARNKKA